MTTNERDKASEQPATDGGDNPSRVEPPGLDERIAIAMRLLPRFRALSLEELRTLTVQLRVLSNIAEGWAQRAGDASRCDDP